MKNEEEDEEKWIGAIRSILVDGQQRPSAWFRVNVNGLLSMYLEKASDPLEAFQKIFEPCAKWDSSHDLVQNISLPPLGNRELEMKIIAYLIHELKPSGASYSVLVEDASESSDFEISGIQVTCDVENVDLILKVPDIQIHRVQLGRRTCFLDCHASAMIDILDYLTYPPITANETSISLDSIASDISEFSILAENVGSSSFEAELMKKIGNFPSLVTLEVSSNLITPNALSWFRSILARLKTFRISLHRDLDLKSTARLLQESPYELVQLKMDGSPLSNDWDFPTARSRDGFLQVVDLLSQTAVKRPNCPFEQLYMENWGLKFDNLEVEEGLVQILESCTGLQHLQMGIFRHRSSFDKASSPLLKYLSKQHGQSSSSYPPSLPSIQLDGCHISLSLGIHYFSAKNAIARKKLERAMEVFEDFQNIFDLAVAPKQAAMDGYSQEEDGLREWDEFYLQSLVFDLIREHPDRLAY